MTNNKIKVAINGFGRIGRNFFRAVVDSEKDIEVVAINDLGSVEVMAHLLANDSVLGAFEKSVETSSSKTGNEIVVDGNPIPVLAERDPKNLPWEKMGVDIIIESTGFFTDRKTAGAHLEAGAKRVIISAPGKDVDATFVVGVNDNTFDKDKHFVVSNASCTTNCFVPMVKVLDDAFGVEQGFMTTVHAYTGDQALVDGPHSDLRRARAAAINIVPTSTGAARATSLVLQSMEGKLDGTALRVPIPNGSLTDFTAILKKPASVENINAAFKSAAKDGALASVLTYSDAPLVSSDIVGSPASCTFDSPMTMSMEMGGSMEIGGEGNTGGTLAKVFAWYDNEWGYSNRLVDLITIMGG